MTENLDLHKMAKNTLRPRKLARNGKAGYVASALLTENDNVLPALQSMSPARSDFAQNIQQLQRWLRQAKHALKKLSRCTVTAVYFRHAAGAGSLSCR
jgi:hypothetical protein